MLLRTRESRELILNYLTGNFIYRLRKGIQS